MKRQFAQIFQGKGNQRFLIVIGSAHKVGSTWLHDLVAEVCWCTPLRIPTQVRKRYRNCLPVDINIDDILSGIQRPSGNRVLKSHSYPPIKPLPEWVKLVTICRDPHDVMVSSSFYLANLPDHLGGWGKDFRMLDEKQRIRKLMEDGGFLKDQLRAWHQCDAAYQLRYESLLDDPVKELARLGPILGFDMDGGELEQAVELFSFKKRSGRDSGQEDKNAFLRKGIKGDWKNYFDSTLLSALKDSDNGDWNKLILELDYENDENWSL